MSNASREVKFLQLSFLLLFSLCNIPFLVVKTPNNFQTGKLHMYSVIYSKCNCHFKCLTLHLRKADVHLMNVRPKEGPSGVYR